MTSVLIRDRREDSDRGQGHLKTGAETGVKLPQPKNTWATRIAEVDNGIYTEITASSYSKLYFCLEEPMGDARASQCLIGFLL